jgi:intracellular septation protein A
MSIIVHCQNKASYILIAIQNEKHKNQKCWFKATTPYKKYFFFFGWLNCLYIKTNQATNTPV